MKKTLIIAGVAVVVLLIARRAMAQKNNPYNPDNWEYLPGYQPQSGVIT